MFRRKSDYVYLLIGLVFAALPYIFPKDYIYLRFPFITFIAFQFGPRAGILTTIPTALAVFIFSPEWVVAASTAPPVYAALLLSAPFVAYFAGIIKRYSDMQRRYLPLLGLFIAFLAYELYMWIQNKPYFIKAPFIFVIAIAAYFLFKYRPYLKYVKTFFWLLVIHYLISFILYFPLTRFSGTAGLFHDTLLYFLPGDILAAFLGAVFFPQLEIVLKSFKRSKAAEDED